MSGQASEIDSTLAHEQACDDLEATCLELASSARTASRQMALARGSAKNAWLAVLSRCALRAQRGDPGR